MPAASVSRYRLPGCFVELPVYDYAGRLVIETLETQRRVGIQGNLDGVDIILSVDDRGAQYGERGGYGPAETAGPRPGGCRKLCQVIDLLSVLRSESAPAARRLCPFSESLAK